MKKLLFMLLIPLVLLSGCYPSYSYHTTDMKIQINPQDIAYKTTNYTLNTLTGAYTEKSYYLVGKDGNWYGVNSGVYKDFKVVEK